MSLTIPLAEVSPGIRAPRIREATPEHAGVAAAFGARLAEIGETLEADRLDREIGRVRVDLARDLGEARMRFEAETDPDALETGWAATAAGLREATLMGVDKRNAHRAELMFDEMANGHGLQLGARALDLRQGQYRINLDTLGNTLRGQAGAMDAETRAAGMDAYADALAEAVAAGALDPEEANTRLRGQLDATDRAAALRLLDEAPDDLIARLDAGEFDGLDGVYREGLRSRATSALRADEARATAEANRVEAERARAIGDRLATITGNARDGRLNAWEVELMADPEVQTHPGYAEAEAAVWLRDTLPEFATLPPGEQAARIAAERARPVSERFETRYLSEMEGAHAAGVAAWERDAIAQARAVGLEPPPPLPEDLVGDPGGLAEAFAARRGYGRSLATAGYVPRPQFFSIQERTALAEATDVGADPAARAALAAAFVAGFGPEAVAALAEIGGDEVFAHMGGLAASGGSPALTAAAFNGQQLLAEKLVVLPKAEAIRAAVDDTLGDLFAEDTPLEGQVMRAAEALYAARARGVDPASSNASRIYEQALQEVLGQSVNARGRKTGGVQRVRGTETLLPMGVEAGQVEAALQTARSRLRTSADDLAPWAAASASGGAPTYAGNPIDASVAGDVRLRAVGNDLYAPYVERRGERFDLIDDASGGPYVLRLSRFLREVGL